MARLPRLAAAGQLHHVLHRGNNRQPVFTAPEDYQAMHEMLVEQSRAEGVAVHAWLLMENHFHLLATPSEAQGLARMMQGVGRRYVRHHNRRTGRSGTLWEGRYRSTVVQPSLLLPCMVYLDLNPVRAQVVERVDDYPWSSHRHYVGRQVDRLVTVHPLFWQIGDTPFARESAYAALVARGLARDVLAAITDATLYGWALGDPDFIAALAERTGRRMERGDPAGRPKSALVDLSPFNPT